MRLFAATTFSILSLVSFLTLAPSAAQARVEPFPPAFKNEMIATNGTKLYVRRAGTGPPLVLLHGYRDRRHVGAACRKTRARSHSDCAGSSRHGPLRAAGRRLRQKDSRPGHRRNPRRAE